MNRKVLVLNQDFSPMTVCTIQRAFVMVFLRKAELLRERNGFELRTINQAFPMPAVIRINHYINIPYRGVVLTRQNIFKRDGFSCQYCGIGSDLTLDHVLPKSRSGKSTWSNLVTACKSCNSRKGDYLPDEIGSLLRAKPYKPSYVMFLSSHSGYILDEWKPFLNGHRRN